jgi:hypothetical protein
MALSPRLEYSNGGLGHKFGLPDLPLPRTEHFKRRYDPVVEQLTKGLMRHGKLSVAQKVCFLLIMLLLDMSRLPLLSFFSEHVYHTRYTADCTSTSAQSCTSAPRILPAGSHLALVASTIPHSSNRLRRPFDQDSTTEGRHGRRCLASHPRPARRPAKETDSHAMDIEQRRQTQRDQTCRSRCAGNHQCC